MSARRSELQHLKRLQENPADSGDDRHSAGRPHLPPNPHGRPRPGDGSQPELDGIFGRALGGRHAGCRDKRNNGRTWPNPSQPPNETVRKTERFSRNHFRQLETRVTFDDPKAYHKPWTGSNSARPAPDTEIMEAVRHERPDNG